MKKNPKVKSVHYSVNSANSQQIFGRNTLLLAGEPYIVETIGSLSIKLSPEAFHQLNTKQMQVLYEEVNKACELKGTEVIVDAFCGVGITTLQLALKAKMVYGIDYSEPSIKDAKMNAQANKIGNAVFYADRVERTLPSIINKKGKPDIILFDPPRTGLDDLTIKLLLKLRINKIVYISCNPSTLAKNINDLLNAYEIQKIIPIDMFPQTASVESMTILKLREENKV